MKSKFMVMGSLVVFACFAVGIMWGRIERKKEIKNESIERVDEDTIRLSPNVLKNIKTSKIEINDFPERLGVMGRIGLTEDRMTVVPSRVAGRIDAVFLASGESVNKGEMLARLFSPDFIAASEEFIQSFKQSQRGGVGSDSSDFNNLFHMARKKLENMGLNENDIAELQKMKSGDQPNLIIRAPRTGVIFDKKAVVGNITNVGDPLFTIADISRVWFTGDVYPEDVQKLKKDQIVVIEAAEKEKLLGSISFISPVVDPTARTIKIRALIDNPKLILRADMYTQGFVILNQRKALIVPNEALARLENNYFVFKKVGEREFKKMPVETSGEQQGMTAIAKGINSGDEIVTEGGLLLSAALSATADNQ